METATKAEEQICFGKLYDGGEKECQVCASAKECREILIANTSPTEPALPEDGIVTVLEEKAAEAEAEKEIAAVEAAEAKVAETEAAEVVEDIVKAEEAIAKEAKAKPAKAPKEPKPAGSREITSLKAVSFKKDDDGKFHILPEGFTDSPDLAINAGDVIEVVNPKSKYNGKQFKVSCYSTKYECIRATALDDKKAADFYPQHVKIV